MEGKSKGEGVSGGVWDLGAAPACSQKPKRTLSPCTRSCTTRHLVDLPGEKSTTSYQRGARNTLCASISP